MLERLQTLQPVISLYNFFISEISLLYLFKTKLLCRGKHFLFVFVETFQIYARWLYNFLLFVPEFVSIFSNSLFAEPDRNFLLPIPEKLRLLKSFLLFLYLLSY